MRKQHNNSSEKRKFKRFYLFGILFWILLVVIYVLGFVFLGFVDWPTKIENAMMAVLKVLFVYGIIGVPIVFFCSFFILLAEPIMDAIQTRIKK